MEWIEGIHKAIRYIEDNITEELTMEEIAKQASLSPFYFQKGFAMLCGFTVGEYKKRRRLTLAGSELVSTDNKIIDIALKYGYDSPDGFTKAFTRFHGVTPTSVRRGEAMIKSFTPLQIKFTLVGGYSMDYKIVKKEAFSLIGVSRMFRYEDAATGVSKLWKEYHEEGKDKQICSVYGVSIDEAMGGDTFEYLIADEYEPGREIADGFTTRIIPEHTWAVFACTGKSSDTIPAVHQQIFSQWLPNCKEYEIAEGYLIEKYSDPADFAKGTQDDKYYSEIWIPVRRK